MKLNFIPLFLLFLPQASLAAPPSMLDLAIGSEFPDKSPFKNQESDLPRPTIQFYVPNSGKSQKLFPEYEVAILRSNNEVLIISGRKVFKTMEDCENAQKTASIWITEVIANSTLSQKTRMYESKSGNTIASLNCSYRGHGPYPILELQFRGKKQNENLKAAWESYFKK